MMTKDAHFDQLKKGLTRNVRNVQFCQGSAARICKKSASVGMYVFGVLELTNGLKPPSGYAFFADFLT